MARTEEGKRKLLKYAKKQRAYAQTEEHGRRIKSRARLDVLRGKFKETEGQYRQSIREKERRGYAGFWGNKPSTSRGDYSYKAGLGLHLRKVNPQDEKSSSRKPGRLLLALGLSGYHSRHLAPCAV